MQESKKIYDQLAVVTPIVMALSAAAPIYRGYLCDVDCRWNVISAAVDDRTDEVSHFKLKVGCAKLLLSHYIMQFIMFIF